MTIKKQKNGRSRDRLFVYKQTRDQEKERERERERERVPSHRFLHPGGTINNHLRSDPKHFWGRKLHILVIIDAATTITTTADNEGSRHTFRYLHCRRRSHKQQQQDEQKPHTLLAARACAQQHQQQQQQQQQQRCRTKPAQAR